MRWRTCLAEPRLTDRWNLGRGTFVSPFFRFTARLTQFETDAYTHSNNLSDIPG